MDVNGVDPCGILRDRFAQGLGTYGKTLDSGGERTCILASGLQSGTRLEMDSPIYDPHRRHTSDSDSGSGPELFIEFAATPASLQDKPLSFRPTIFQASMATRRPLSQPVLIKPPLSNCCWRARCKQGFKGFGGIWSPIYLVPEGLGTS